MMARDAALLAAADALAAAAGALRAAAEAGEPVDGPERLLSITEAAAALSVGRSALYSELQAGRLRSMKIGRRRLIPAGALAAFIDEGCP